MPSFPSLSSIPRPPSLGTLKTRLRNPSPAQKRTLIALAVNAIAILVLYNVSFLTPLLYPFKILTVAFHESCHALMTWITGGSVRYITLNPYEGGVTGSVGGARCLILPAGYLGSSTIGAILVFTTFNFSATSIAAICISILMLVTLFVSRNAFAVITTLLVVLSVGATFYPRINKVRLPNRTHLGPVLRYVIVMFTGTMSALYSINDIVSDVVIRQAEGSDASLFARDCIWLPTVVWGVLWTMASLAFLGTGIVAGLVFWKSEEEEDDDVFAQKAGSYFTLV